MHGASGVAVLESNNGFPFTKVAAMQAFVLWDNLPQKKHQHKAKSNHLVFISISRTSHVNGGPTIMVNIIFWEGAQLTDGALLINEVAKILFCEPWPWNYTHFLF